VEDARLVHASLGDQEMEMRVELMRSPNVWMAAMTPGVSALPLTTMKYRVNERRAKRQSSPSSRRLYLKNILLRPAGPSYSNLSL
jgi:hypothetical protein